MKHISLFIVLVETPIGNRYQYNEEGYNAQEAVDKVSTYKDEKEKIIMVFKQVENWTERN